MSAVEAMGARSPPSPRAFAMQHQRPKSSYKGCSPIRDYEFLGKLGEGTFGYGRHEPHVLPRSH